MRDCMDWCREHSPLFWDSFMQSPRQHSFLHCFPLYFFLTPLAIVTISFFLYFCCPAVTGVTDLDEDRLMLRSLKDELGRDDRAPRGEDMTPRELDTLLARNSGLGMLMSLVPL